MMDYTSSEISIGPGILREAQTIQACKGGYPLTLRALRCNGDQIPGHGRSNTFGYSLVRRLENLLSYAR